MAKNEYTNEIFKQRIRELIEPKLSECKSFNALSKLIDIPATSLNEYYNGVRVATAENLVKFSKFFGVSTDYLLGLNTNSDIESVCNYLGISYKTALGLKEDISWLLIANPDDAAQCLEILENVTYGDNYLFTSVVETIIEMLLQRDMNFINNLEAMKFNKTAKDIRSSPYSKDMSKYFLFEDMIDICNRVISEKNSLLTESEIEDLKKAENPDDVATIMFQVKSPILKHRITSMGYFSHYDMLESFVNSIGGSIVKRGDTDD